MKPGGLRAGFAIAHLSLLHLLKFKFSIFKAAVCLLLSCDVRKENGWCFASRCSFDFPASAESLRSTVSVVKGNRMHRWPTKKGEIIEVIKHGRGGRDWNGRRRVAALARNSAREKKWKQGQTYQQKDS